MSTLSLYASMRRADLQPILLGWMTCEVLLCMRMQVHRRAWKALHPRKLDARLLTLPFGNQSLRNVLPKQAREEILKIR